MQFARKLMALLAVMAVPLCAGFVQAGEPPHDGFFDSVSIYQGQGVDHNLRDLPGAIITGDVDWDKTYFSAIGLSKIRGILADSFDGLQDTTLGSFRHGYELILVQHHGLQHNAEIDGAWSIRTPDGRLGPVGVNFSIGAGLSYALGTPSYEDGPTDDPDRRYRLQFLALFEFEWFARAFEQLSIITRIHHRSGIYGTVAPPHVGSNFLVAGIRYHF
jgi:hypothetical protein